ncbi:MAG: DUF104 domain-containing protein [Defluviitaleaceae bacterium]|nr:DUF104 domain-containing protein [Defluviitaleaceae bacterium]
MQAVKAYYDDGKFVPLKPITIPKGSQAIVTILDFPENKSEDSYKTRSNDSRIQWLNQLESAIELSMNEELPDIYFQRSKSMNPPLDLKD